MPSTYYAYRLQAGEAPDDPPDWICHTDWCETPDSLREPLSRDKALEIIEWDRQRGDRYCIRAVCPEEDMK